MQFYYGGQMPLRILDEAEAWKRQETEHSIILGEFAVDLEQEYVDHLRGWSETLDETHLHIRRLIETVTISDHQLYEQILELISFCMKESAAFKQFCQEIINNSIATRENHMIKIFIQHMISVSDDYISTAQTILHDRIAK